jgi:hypothetical protein
VFNNGSVLSNISYQFFKSWIYRMQYSYCDHSDHRVEKVSEPGNLVPRNVFELRVLQKIFQKIFQHFEITLFTQLTNYNYSTLFTLYTLTSAAFKYLTEINSFTDSCHHNEVNGKYMFCKVSKKMQIK